MPIGLGFMNRLSYIPTVPGMEDMVLRHTQFDLVLTTRKDSLTDGTKPRH